MCGIAGVFYRDRERPVEREMLERMGRAIAHRGPDGEGYLAESGIGLVHRRLSIIDLEGGAQPIGNEDGSVQVVFNGEIYNYPQLRQELIARGHRFQTRADTEVLVHLYEDHGEELVKHLRGMFAFAIWDKRKRRLLLARDRIGLKPLYVYRDERQLLFGSELKAILTSADIDRTLDLDALEDYLCFGMVPGRRSIFRRVSKLRPAHTLVVDADGWNTAPAAYWQYSPQVDRQPSLAEWKERIAAKVDEAVDVHRLSDVPVGAFLSGGVDSSVVVSLLARLSDQAPQTFSIGFSEERFSELPYARELAERYGCAHVERIVTPRAAASLEQLVHYYDEPFADSSAIPTMAVAELASQHVKVVLTGDGGDEAFGGYARYAHDLEEARWRRRVPQWLRQGPLRSLARHWPRADWLPRPLRAKTRLTNLSLDPARAYANTLSWSRSLERRKLLHADVQSQMNGHDPEQIVSDSFCRAAQDDELAGMITADVDVLLPDQFLTKVDRATMAFGLEARPPLVDHELLELTSRLPSEFKVRGGTTKWLMKEMFREQLPAAVVDRPKQGFEIPVDAWLRGPLQEVFQDTVLAPGARVSALIDQPSVAAMFQSHQRRTSRHGNVLWSLLVLGQWCEHYLGPPIAVR